MLDVRNLQAWYGESQSLYGISLHVDLGETVALLGRNGAGKSTTLKAICGDIPLRSGSVVFDGEEITRDALHKVARRGIAYVPEHRGIFATLSVRENMLLPPVCGKGGATDSELRDLFPNLFERSASRGTTLSGGEQQMLAIARVLRTGARLFLLDEPSEGLAPVIVQKIAQLIRSLKEKGYTILLVEQNLKFAKRIADRYYVLENGRIVDELTGAQALESDRIQRLLGI